MTTITDPAGSPAVVYNRSGTTIVNLTANGTSSGTATVIPAASKETVAVVTTDSSNKAVILPPSPEIGDLVKVFGAPGISAPVSIFPPSGMSFASAGAGPITLLSGGNFRYLAANTWFLGA